MTMTSIYCLKAASLVTQHTSRMGVRTDNLGVPFPWGGTSQEQKGDDDETLTNCSSANCLFFRWCCPSWLGRTTDQGVCSSRSTTSAVSSKQVPVKIAGRTRTSPCLAIRRMSVLPTADEVDSFTLPLQRMKMPSAGWPSTKSFAPLDCVPLEPSVMLEIDHKQGDVVLLPLFGRLVRPAGQFIQESLGELICRQLLVVFDETHEAVCTKLFLR